MQRSGTKGMEGAARRAQILHCAQDLIETSGFVGLSVGDVARAAGVSKPLVYLHFASKDDLLLAVLEATHTRIVEALRRVERESDGGAETSLRAAIEAMFDIARAEPVAMRLVVGRAVGLTPELDAATRKMRMELIRVVIDLILPFARQGFPEVSRDTVRPFAVAMMGAVEGCATWWANTPSASRKSSVDATYIVLWTGLERLVTWDGS